MSTRDFIEKDYYAELGVSKTASQEEALSAARAIAEVQKHLEGKTVVKEIYVPGRIINIVVK